MEPVLPSPGTRRAAGQRAGHEADVVSGARVPAALGLMFFALSAVLSPGLAAAASPNQQATSASILGLGSSSELYWALMSPFESPGSNPDLFIDFERAEVQQLLTQLSGDAHASYTSTVMLADLDLSQAPMGNLRRNLNDPANAMPFWVQVYRGKAHLDGDGNAGKAEQKFDGMMLGGDLPIPGDWRFGGAFGYGDERMDVDSRNARADSDSYRYALYGGRDFDLGFGPLKFSGGAGYSEHRIDSRRSVELPGGQEQLGRRYDVTTQQAFGELAYHWALGEPAYVEPFFGVLTLEQRSDGFQERGGMAALTAQSQRNRLLSTTTGVRGQQVFLLAGRELLLYGAFTWRQINGDLRPEMEMNFEGSERFRVRGSEMPRNSYLVVLNADYSLTPNVVLDLDYSGVFSNSSRSNSFAVNLRWKM